MLDGGTRVPHAHLVTDVPSPAAVGVADHSGWANLVTVSVAAGGRSPVVVDRRRCELLGPEVPRQPYHAATELDAAEAEALVARVADAALIGARSALATVTSEVGPACRPVVLALRAGGDRPLPETVAGVLASHAAMHAAEGQLYRDALAEAAAGLGLEVVLHARGDEVAEATTALGVDADGVAETVAALGRTVGPPWQKEHREAATAALAELARRTRLRLDA
jgi:hypothetical protein